MIVITEFVGENNEVILSAYTIDGIRAETWLDDDGNVKEEFAQTGVRFVLDEDTELGQRILAADLQFDPVIDDDGNLIDIIPRTPATPEPEPNIHEFVLGILEGLNDERL